MDTSLMEMLYGECSLAARLKRVAHMPSDCAVCILAQGWYPIRFFNPFTITAVRANIPSFLAPKNI